MKLIPRAGMTIALLVLMVSLTNCTRTKRAGALDSTPNPFVVIVNTGKISRGDAAELIDTLTSCNAKVIGWNAVLFDFNHTTEDTLLAQAIAHSGRTILCGNILSDMAIELPHPFFSSQATAIGLNTIVINEDKSSDKYVPLLESATGQFLSFPVALALHYSETDGERIFSSLSVNEVLPIYNHEELELRILEAKAISCEDVEGKVVIMGDLTKAGEQMPQSITFAFIVNDLLSKGK